MILLYAKKLSEDVLFRWVDKVGLCVAAITLLSLIWAWFGYFATVSRDKQMLEEGAIPPLFQAFPGEVIGQGPLRLRPVHASRWVARVAGEITLLAYNSRPDQGMQEAQVILQLKEGKKQVAIPNGGVLYLQELEGGGLSLSESRSPLWVKPLVLDETSALLEVGRQLANETIEKGEFITSFQGMGHKGSGLVAESIAAFKSSSAFAQDLVIQKYGGAEFAIWNQAIGVDLQGEEGPYGLRLFPGDHLMYESGEWRVVKLEELEMGNPVGKVLAASERGLDIEIWDENGFSPARIKVDVKKIQRAPFGPEWIPSLARFRSPSQVTCVFGKRRMILRSGDWLIRGTSGWRHLRSAEEIQMYLDRKVKGDLFVCEAIERDLQGKGVIKGSLFDETRTYSQPVQVPVSSDKPPQKSSRKRRVSSANRGSL